jgi:hypothetical protein
MRKQYFRTILLLFVAYSSFAANDLRIYQIYGGGGNASATYVNDFIMLYNNGNSSINLSDYNIQYAPATSLSWSSKQLTGSIPGKSFYLIEIYTTGTTGSNLPTADMIWSDLANSGINTSDGKVALMLNSVTAIPSPSNAVDFVGYGSDANAFEGSGPATIPSPTSSPNSKSFIRKDDGVDTDNNSADFVSSTTGSPSGVRASNSTSFPVILVYLDVAKYGESAILDWKTSEELNFSHFEIQKSKDAVGFESVGKVSSNKGLSSIYTFVDNQPAPGVNYYRLKMVDLDGKIEYSKINSINFASELNVVLYPNPSSDFVKLNNINLKEISQVTVSDIQGKILKVFNDNFDTMPINELQSQYYIIRVYASTGKLYSYKLLKI